MKKKFFRGLGFAVLFLSASIAAETFWDMTGVGTDWTFNDPRHNLVTIGILALAWLTAHRFCGVR